MKDILMQMNKTDKDLNEKIFNNIFCKEMKNLKASNEVIFIMCW